MTTNTGSNTLFTRLNSCLRSKYSNRAGKSSTKVKTYPHLRRKKSGSRLSVEFFCGQLDWSSLTAPAVKNQWLVAVIELTYLTSVSMGLNKLQYLCCNGWPVDRP